MCRNIKRCRLISHSKTKQAPPLLNRFNQFLFFNQVEKIDNEKADELYRLEMNDFVNYQVCHVFLCNGIRWPLFLLFTSLVCHIYRKLNIEINALH